MLKEKVGDRLVAFAMVSDSTIMRGIVTAVTWLVPPSYAMTITKEPDRALSWLSQAYPDFSLQQVKEDICLKVPAASLHRDWREPVRKVG